MKRISWLLLFSSRVLLSQEPMYDRAIHYDVKDGLPQNTITGIFQSTDGFIWVTTMDGLARFDGHNFLTFRSEPNDSSSLPFNTIGLSLSDAAGYFWLYSLNSNIAIFNPINLNSTHFKLDLSKKSINAYSYLNLLRGCKRKISIQDVEELMKHLTLEEKVIKTCSEDASGRLWILEGNGFSVSDSTWTSFTFLPFPQNFEIESNALGYDLMFHLPDGRIAILIKTGGMIIYNPNEGSIKKVKIPPTTTKSASVFADITKDETGRLVFESRKRIYRLEKNDSLTLLFNYDSGPGIRRIFIDRSNTLWIGTDSDGLYSINLFTPRFVSKKYKRGFIADVLLNELKVDLPSKEEYNLDDANPYWLTYAYDHNKLLFLFTGDDHLASRINLIKGKSISKFFATPNRGPVAIAPDNSIYYLDGTTELFHWRDLEKPPSKSKLNVWPDDGQPLQVDANYLWLSNASDGVLQFDITNFKLVHKIKPDNNFNSNVIKNDLLNDNILWIGTIGDGLHKWDKIQSKLLASYRMKDGLPNNTINSIVLDSLGNLWMSTNFGISRFNPQTETFTNYNETDGINESEFNRHHELLLPDGRMAMGGTQGYSVFNPKDFREDNFNPRTLITNVSINGKLLDHQTDSLILKTSAAQLMNLSLPYTDNTLGFEISSDEFNAPDKIKFRYRLEGSVDHWIDNGYDRNVRFNNLPFGNYTLLLNASNTSGRWSSSIRKIEIVIHPPFWLTWWAYSFYALILGITVRLYWRNYKKRLKEKQEAEFNVREAARLKEVDEIKTRFFSNITHEFRTPLTLILSPLEKHLKDGSLSPKALTLLNNNYRHASQLLKLVNQLLDIAKLEAGQMLVSPTAGELSVFVEQCITPFKPQAEDKNIQLMLSFSQVEGHYLFDHDKWEKILFNLLSNAIKFTPLGGSIMVTITDLKLTPQEKSVIQVKVEDTGVGIDQNKLPGIFERFYQADDSSTREHEGTGIGLALVKELVGLMDGDIYVESEIGKGTSFRIELAIEKLKEIPAAKEVTSVNTSEILEEPVPGTDHDNPLILIVEDNAELLSFIKESLAANWQILDATNGLDGWTIIERELPDIVISDVMMPGMNGFELCHKAKHDPRTNHISFIMLTAKAAQESKIEGLQSGADDYITKPFHLQELELRIRNQLIEKNNLRKHLQEKVLPDKPQTSLPHVNDVFLSKLQDYLDSQLTNSLLSAEDAAEAMAMSKRTINRKLSALIGLSISDYIKKYRLQKSLALLASGLTVTEISYQVGFESPSYFTQCFKEVYKQTPTDYTKSSALSQN